MHEKSTFATKKWTHIRKLSDNLGICGRILVAYAFVFADETFYVANADASYISVSLFSFEFSANMRQATDFFQAAYLRFQSAYANVFIFKAHIFSDPRVNSTFSLSFSKFRSCVAKCLWKKTRTNWVLSYVHNSSKIPTYLLNNLKIFFLTKEKLKIKKKNYRTLYI